MTSSAPQRFRRAYIDWTRGLAVIVMIFAHTIDAWTRPSDRGTPAYALAVKIAGMGAPLFLFLAGISVALSAGAKTRKGGDRGRAVLAVAARGLQIFGLAFLFRLQSWALGMFRSPVSSLLKVDILNIMGPSIAIAAGIWGLSARASVRFALLAAAAVLVSFVTPPLRAASWPVLLPDPIEWYLRPPPGRSWFTLFPWAGLLLAGAAVGVVLDCARDPDTERRANVGLAPAGATLVGLAFAGAYLPSLFANSSFWTTSLSYFFLRIGLMTFVLSLVYWWCQHRAAHRWSPMLVFGNSSLFVYWIHVELVYGGFSQRLHRALSFGQALGMFVAFTALMLVVTMVKNWTVSRWGATGGSTDGAAVGKTDGRSRAVP
jgi:uncharacterized membrane protein